jgi:hypothetical protein
LGVGVTDCSVCMCSARGRKEGACSLYKRGGGGDACGGSISFSARYAV